jgi:aspartate/tyrosine/aromatic aminotransferase
MYRTAGGGCDTLSVMSYFSRLAPVPPDPIFAVAALARLAGSDAIDASIGELRDEDGGPFFLPSVQQSLVQWERETVPGAGGFPLPPLLGLPAFRDAVRCLAVGEEVPVASIATTGGTGALAIHCKLLRQLSIKRVILPVPTWPAHLRLLEGAGMDTITVPFTADDAGVDAVLETLTRVKESSAVLLQISGHNPSGWTWSRTQWQRLADGLSGASHVVLLDCAYQGLAQGVREDVEAVRILRAADVPVLLAWSASKNHTIYGLRTGLACALISSEEERERTEGHFARCTRELCSAAPTPGQHIVTVVQRDLRPRWEEELSDVRALLQRKRSLLLEAFPDWSAHLQGVGFFTLLPLDAAAVLRLRERSVFLTDDGRVNLGGIPLRRMDAFVDAIRGVVE